MNSAYTVPLFLRGELITDDLVSFGTRTALTSSKRPTWPATSTAFRSPHRWR